MAKPKPPAWLTTAFAAGVSELAPARPAPVYKGALGRCWLAQHDERRRPCSAPLERAHLIPRQRVENALGALLPRADAAGMIACGTCNAFSHLVDACPDCEGGLIHFPGNHRTDLIQLAAWDPRNGVIACEGHHRRFDNHATPPLFVPSLRLPAHALDFVLDWGLESQMRDRFPN